MPKLKQQPSQSVKEERARKKNQTNKQWYHKHKDQINERRRARYKQISATKKQAKQQAAASNENNQHDNNQLQHDDNNTTMLTTNPLPPPAYATIIIRTPLLQQQLTRQQLLQMYASNNSSLSSPFKQQQPSPQDINLEPYDNNDDAAISASTKQMLWEQMLDQIALDSAKRMEMADKAMLAISPDDSHFMQDQLQQIEDMHHQLILHQTEEEDFMKPCIASQPPTATALDANLPNIILDANQPNINPINQLLVNNVRVLR